ncbi:GNAT family N-acetyltransferase [Streptococcus sp. DD04]|uniref:GNAT family N-acetyltransferase n=1 Tax=Streptococcus sp. DD04 TaxID=1776578 RepID=UPI000783054E|nr:GNAT family protein [Streptococcus sp. DD04]KXT63049.1 acetyltransferase, GNAT family [Streptococcus sp. DD04]
MKKIGTQSIETKRLLLRPFVESDYQAMYDNWASRPDNLLDVTWDAYESPDMAKQSIACWGENYQNLDFYKWAICLKENPYHVIGDISVVDLDETVNAGEVGYILGKDYWGQGLMTEALKVVLNYLLLEAGFNRVRADFVTANPASGRVMAKAGMSYEGTFRQAVFHKGEVKDFSVYGILKSDLKRKS